MSVPDSDLDIGMVVLCGDWYWRKGPRWMAFKAFLFGSRQTFEHLGMRSTVSWYRDHPYLIKFGPVSP